jgi:hypothetical protein
VIRGSAGRFAIHSPENRGAAWFDGAVFLANLFLVGPLTRLVHVGEDVSPLFGAILLAGTFSYSVGAWFKRRPLQARMMKEPLWGGYAFLLFLVLGTMHLGVFALAAGLGVEALRLPSWLGIAGVLPTVLAVHAMLPMRVVPEGDEKKLRVREAGADAALYLGTIVLFALWEGALVPTVAGKAGGNWLMAVVLVVLMTVPFAIFYLAPRMLFLVEDFRKRSTWGRVLLVALPMAWRLAVP